MLKIGVLASGGGTNLQAILDKIESGYLHVEVATVVSNNENAYVLERARKSGVPAQCISKKNYPDLESYENALIQHFKDKGVQLIVQAGFLVILGSGFVKEFENRIMNIHPSLIPSFCGRGFYGLRVHEAVLARGVKVTGATVHFVDTGTDTGPIILQKSVEVYDGDTPEVLQKRVMAEAEWVILPKAIQLFAENKLIVEDNIVKWEVK